MSTVDDVDGVPGGGPEPLGWPLVDRRRSRGGEAPDGVERRQRPSGSRLHQLAEANQLLVALHQVSQTLPTSLDLDEVLDAAVSQIRGLLGGDVVTVLVRDSTDNSFVPVRGRGSADGSPLTDLPPSLEAAIGQPTAVRFDRLEQGVGVAAEARCGVYVAATARHLPVALVAVESRTENAFAEDAVPLLTAVSEPFAVAVDNARLFRRIRTVAADEERRRLARDVHDRIGSSVALLGFEVDRILADAARGGDTEQSLRQLRGQITTVVGEVRETLNDLRTEVTDERDLGGTLRSFLDRLSSRSGLITHLDLEVDQPLPRPQERELWRMALEALVNVERHSGASTVWVAWWSDGRNAELVIRDDGKGLRSDQRRADSYGLTGMRERAAAIGARLSVTGVPEAGTTVHIRVGATRPTTQTGRTA